MTSSYVTTTRESDELKSLHIPTGEGGTINNYVALREAFETIIIFANPSIPRSVIEIAFGEAVEACQH